MAKSMEYALPETQHCVLSVGLDMKQKVETILMGELKTVQHYINFGEDKGLLFFKKRAAGLLLKDFVPMPIELADMKAALLGSTGKHTSHLFSWAAGRLRASMRSDNPIAAFTAVLLWQEYHKALRSKQEENLLDLFDDITFPLRFSVTEEVKRWQEMDKRRPLRYMNADFRKHPVQIYYDHSEETREYGVADTSTASLLVYYLKRIYAGNMYIQTCPLCQNPFIAKTIGKKTFCSDECKRESLRVNKKRFDDKAREISYEQAHKNDYMYWYNKIVKIRKSRMPKDKLEKIEQAFDTHVKEAKKRKKAVKLNQAGPASYENWLLSKRGEIDQILKESEVYL